MKNKFFHGILPCILLCAVLAACSSIREIGNEMEVEYTQKAIKYSALTSETKFILPESAGDESVVSQISRLLYFDKNVYLLDRKNNRLLAFGEDGRFINSSSKHIGKAANEYIRIKDVSVDCLDSLIWVYCDAPYQFMLFDTKLNLKQVIPCEHLVKEFAVEGNKIYMLVSDVKEWNHYELLCSDKSDMEKTCHILDYKKAIPSAGGLGMSLAGSMNRVLVSMPFDNVIYELSNGVIQQSWAMVMKDWFSWKETKGRQFYRENTDQRWFIQNIVKGDSVLLFNTNKAEIYVLTKGEKCVAYPVILGDDFALSDTWLTTVGGMDGYVAQVVQGTSLLELKGIVEKNNKVRQEMSPHALKYILNASATANPLLILRKLH